jgi:Leucine-rich repeat (LRR) protein
MCLILTSAHAGLAQAQAPIPEEQTNPHFPQEFLEDYEEPWLRYQKDAPKQEREFIPPTEESLKRTQEQVQAFDCGTVTDVPRIECEALVALYESTNGAGWTDNTNWLLTNTVGNWDGVEVFASHVAVLNLAYNQLTGTIPSELIQLSNLTVLDLHYNQLSGTIPSELGNLLRLAILDLSHNFLSGSIPTEIGKLIQLIHFDISHNYLTGNMPPSFANLINLCVKGDLGSPCRGVFKTDLGYNLLNVPQPNPPSDFMYVKDPDWDKTQVGRRFFNYLPVINK